MQSQSLELSAARTLADQVALVLDHSPSYRQLDPGTQGALRRDVTTIQHALALARGDAPEAEVDLPPPPAPLHRGTADRAYAEPLALHGPMPAWRRGLQGNDGQSPSPDGQSPDAPARQPAQPTPAERTPTRPATETLAGRVGALSDEVDFPTFVASLVHGAFDAMVNATIRQMEAFASLVSAIAKDVDEFTRDNVTTDQVRDFLVQQHPRDLALDTRGKTAQLRRRQTADGSGDDTSSESPAWLADYGLDAAVLDDQTIEEQLVPAARRHVGEDRMRTLATMVLLGMSRINVKDGTISARVRFRAAARDNAQVAYNQSDDPAGQTSWGARGSAVYDQHQTKISTVSANVQSDSQLNVELFGEVRINFASETLPLDRFLDPARLALIQRHARGSTVTPVGAPEVPAPAPASPTSTPTPSPLPTAPTPPTPAPSAASPTAPPLTAPTPTAPPPTATPARA